MSSNTLTVQHIIRVFTDRFYEPMPSNGGSE